ncbi:hypothetical protein [Clostridium oceanicum]
MNYFYGTLIAELIFFTLIMYKIIDVLKLFLKNKKKRYLVLLVVLIPLWLSLFYQNTFPKIKDINNAFNKNILVYKGTVEKTYISGQFNSFILDGKKYQYNPWKFKPREGNKYKLFYLPNSKFVMKYEKKN